MTISEKIELFIIEDHFDYRHVLEEVLKDHPVLHCEGSFSNVEDALSELESSQKAPHIILLDLGLPGMDGTAAIPLLKAQVPDVKILVLTMFEDKQRVFRALGAGAFGYIVKSVGIEAIVQGVVDAHRGISPLSSDIAQMVFETFSQGQSQSEEDQLSGRELEVLQLLAKGDARAAVAKKLHLSRHTIDTHVRSIYRKLQVQNLSGALNKASRFGLLGP